MAICIGEVGATQAETGHDTLLASGDQPQPPGDEEPVCANCGGAISLDDLVCPHCGISLVSG
ncbi:MAG: hypothetical protein M3457_04965 [Chloroflexota bacterium]|nr:hypothetical protein [Chloroflexota bacterium]